MVEWYWQGKLKNSKKTFSNETSSTIDPTLTNAGTNPWFRSERLATNLLSQSAAQIPTLLSKSV
jgi:hypothetical protein